MRAGVILLALLAAFIVPAAGADWEDHGAVTLKWGETANISGYNISAIDFRPGTVEETKNTTKCLAENDPVLRRVQGCDDWVMLAVFKNNVKVLDAALAKRNITVEGADFFNETTYQSDNETLKIKAEDVVTGYNIPTPYAIIRVFTKSEKDEFDIPRKLSIKKTVPPEAYVNPSRALISVVLDVENIGSTNFNLIDVVDSLPNGFKVEPWTELRWRISLDAGQKWQIIYSIKPIHPGTGQEHSLPQARLYVSNGSRQYNISSNNASFKLFSSDIILAKILEKEAVKPGENISVLVRVENNGSRAALVKVRDALPRNAALVSGVLNFSSVLQPGTFYNNSYVIGINDPGNLTLPPAELTFKEYMGDYDPEQPISPATGNMTSQSPAITVGSASLQLASADSAPAQTSENVEKRDEKQEESIVDGVLKKIEELWNYLKSII